MKAFATVVLLMTLCAILAEADKRTNAKEDKVAKAIIKKSSKEMQKSLILDKKVTILRKKAKHASPQMKKEAILNMAESLNRLASKQKEKAVKEAKKAIDKSPLVAVKSLQKMKNSKSALKKSSAQALAKHIIREKAATAG